MWQAFRIKQRERRHGCQRQKARGGKKTAHLKLSLCDSPPRKRRPRLPAVRRLAAMSPPKVATVDNQHPCQPINRQFGPFLANFIFFFIPAEQIVAPPGVRCLGRTRSRERYRNKAETAFFFYNFFPSFLFFFDTLVSTEACKHHLPAAQPAPLCIYEYSTSINLFVECSHLRRGAQKSHYLSQEVCARTSVRGTHVGRGGLN